MFGGVGSAGALEVAGVLLTLFRFRGGTFTFIPLESEVSDPVLIIMGSSSMTFVPVRCGAKKYASTTAATRHSPMPPSK